MLKIDFSPENLRKLVRMTDTNSDGKVSFEEFERMINAEHVADLNEDREQIEEVRDEEEEEGEKND